MYEEQQTRSVCYYVWYIVSNIAWHMLNEWCMSMSAIGIHPGIRICFLIYHTDINHCYVVDCSQLQLLLVRNAISKQT